MKSVESQKVAAAIRETISDCLSTSELQQDPVAVAILEDIDGILAAQASGAIECGQPRLASQLIRLVERFGDGTDSLPAEIFAAIGECAETGLSAEDHILDAPDRRRRHVTGFEK